MRPWTERDYQPAAAVITAAYRGHVDAQINDQYCSSKRLASFSEQHRAISRAAATFDPTASFVAVHRSLGNLVGIILCSRVREDVGHVTQVCVLPEYAVKEHWQGADGGDRMRILSGRGFRSLSLTVTEANAGAVEVVSAARLSNESTV